MLYTKFQPNISSGSGGKVDFTNPFKVLLILHTKFQSNIPSHFGEMDLNAQVDVNGFRIDVMLV